MHQKSHGWAPNAPETNSLRHRASCPGIAGWAAGKRGGGAALPPTTPHGQARGASRKCMQATLHKTFATVPQTPPGLRFRPAAAEAGGRVQEEGEPQQLFTVPLRTSIFWFSCPCRPAAADARAPLLAQEEGAPDSPFARHRGPPLAFEPAGTSAAAGDGGPAPASRKGPTPWSSLGYVVVLCFVIFQLTPAARPHPHCTLTNWGLPGAGERYMVP